MVRHLIIILRTWFKVIKKYIMFSASNLIFGEYDVAGQAAHLN